MPELPFDSKTFKVLGSDTRLNILRTLDKRKMNLSEISRETKLTEATLHEHLAKLNEAGFIKRKEREGHKWVFYSLSWKAESLLHPEKTRFVLIFSCIAVAAMFILAAVSVPLILKDQEISIITVEGAPKIDYNSLAVGNVVALPDIGHTAVYGFYYKNQKVGTQKVTAEGSETFQNVNCMKITGESSLSIKEMIVDTEMTFDVNTTFTAYNDVAYNRPEYFIFTLDYTQPYQLTSVMIDDYNYATNEIISVTTTLDISTVSITKLPENYWNLSDTQDDFEIGFSQTVNYTTETIDSSSEIEVTTTEMTITIIGQEDVTVPKGTFKDCYILQIEQKQGDNTSITKYWVTEDGELPQMETNTQGLSGMLIKLEKYYKLK